MWLDSMCGNHVKSKSLKGLEIFAYQKFQISFKNIFFFIVIRKNHKIKWRFWKIRERFVCNVSSRSRVRGILWFPLI